MAPDARLIRLACAQDATVGARAARPAIPGDPFADPTGEGPGAVGGVGPGSLGGGAGPKELPPPFGTAGRPPSPSQCGTQTLHHEVAPGRRAPPIRFGHGACGAPGPAAGRRAWQALRATGRPGETASPRPPGNSAIGWRGLERPDGFLDLFRPFLSWA